MRDDSDRERETGYTPLKRKDNDSGPSLWLGLIIGGLILAAVVIYSTDNMRVSQVDTPQSPATRSVTPPAVPVLPPSRTAPQVVPPASSPTR